MIEIFFYTIATICGIILILFFGFGLGCIITDRLEVFKDKYKWRGYKKALNACNKLFTEDNGWKTLGSKLYKSYVHECGLTVDIMNFMIADSCDRHQLKRGGDYRACRVFNLSVDGAGYLNTGYYRKPYSIKIHYRPKRQKTNQWIYQMRDVANNPEKYNKEILLRRYNIDAEQLLNKLG